MKANIESINTWFSYKYFFIILFTLSLFMIWWSGPVSEYGGHDFFFHLRRFEVLIDSLKHLKYPIYLDSAILEGYGYFTKAFYPDLILLPFALLGIFTSSVFAYNVMIFFLTFLCGILMYHFLHVIFKNSFVAFVGGLLYTFSAYHLYDWYQRGALGEAISFTFLPLIFLGLYYILQGDYKKRWYVFTVGYTLLIYTHFLSSFLTFFAVLLVILFNYKSIIREPKRLLYLVLSGLIVIPLVASYIFPMLEQMMSDTFYYSVEENITGQTKLSFSEIGWGVLSGFIYSPDKNLPGIGLLLFCSICLRFFIKERTRLLRLADISAILGIIYILFSSSIFPWGRLPLGFIQFPWRLYEFSTFFWSIAGSYYIFLIFNNITKLKVILLIIVLSLSIVIVLNNSNYIYWQTKAKKEMPEWVSGIPSDKNKYYLGGLEYLPIKVPSYHMFKQRGDSIISQNLNTSVYNFKKVYDKLIFDVSATGKDIIELPLVYYKGYTAIHDDEKLPLQIQESDRGLVQVPISTSGKVQVYYGGTWIQTFSFFITLLSFLLLCIYIFVQRKFINKTL